MIVSAQIDAGATSATADDFRRTNRPRKQVGGMIPQAASWWEPTTTELMREVVPMMARTLALVLGEQVVLPRQQTGDPCLER